MSLMTDDANDSSTIQFPVVGIGASAGGLEAIQQFLEGVPEKSGMAYVFVQHLKPTHESALTEILSRHSKIPVQEVTDDVRLQPDNLYVIPSDKMLTAVDGKLKLDPRNEQTKKIKTIDLFFSSLGVVHQSFAVGVVLSGTLDDGTLGLKVIKAHGGITLVQDDTAQYDGMPQNAIKSGTVDFVLPPGKMASKLIEINRPFKADSGKPSEIIPAFPLVTDDKIFREIISIIRIQKGVDFTHYKQSTVIRRIQRRMAVNNCEKPEYYLSFLKENKTEPTHLFNDMLLPVTDFFRDPKTFTKICASLPEIINSRPINAPIRIWVVGCASGEEAYSLAICIEEFWESNIGNQTMERRKIQIFATDLSDIAIAKARLGIYNQTDLKGLSPDRIEKFFTKIHGSFQINKSLREYCVFAQHNFLKDPPFSKIDMVTCRNVLIYLEPVLQKKAFTVFHYALKADGYLVLGRSESIGHHTNLFSHLSKSEKIYKKNGITGRFMDVASKDTEQKMQKDDKIEFLPVIDAFKKSEEILLEKYTPAGVLINGAFDILQFRGATDAWIAAQPGKASFNLLKMARPALSFEIRNLLHLAKTKGVTVKKEGIAIEVMGVRQYATIECVPIEAAEPHFLILFFNTQTPGSNNEIPGINSGDDKNQGNHSARMELLEKELARNREDMRSITEEQEAANEELQSANEELLSGSEELQAMNEELETAKEELQSSNEELSSLNTELIERFNELNKSRAFSEGVFATLRDAIIILNNEFEIVRATDGFYNKFKITEKESSGVSFFKIQEGHWNLPELKQYLENLNEKKNSFSDFEIRQVFPFIGEKILILNGRQLEREDGHRMMILSVEDITDQIRIKENLIELQKSNLLLQNSNLELEQFAGIASHDLQEPLRKIATFIDIIDKRKLAISDAAKIYLDKISASAIRMQTIIKELLHYSKFNDVNKTLYPTDLNEIVKNVLLDFEISIQDKQAKITIKELPLVAAIPVFMNQLFFNLINNALKFVDNEARPEISITAAIMNNAEVAKHGELNQQFSYSEIIVKDNGIGFDESEAERVFYLFQRLNSSDAYPGNGIGLALCRKIVLQHGGKIFAKSKEKEGTAIHIILPTLSKH